MYARFPVNADDDDVHPSIKSTRAEGAPAAKSFLSFEEQSSAPQVVKEKPLYSISPVDKSVDVALEDYTNVKSHSCIGLLSHDDVSQGLSKGKKIVGLSDVPQRNMDFQPRKNRSMSLCSFRESNCSSLTSAVVRQRAEAKAARIRFESAKREARILKQKAELEAELNLLKIQSTVDEAEAKLKVLQEADECSSRTASDDLNLSVTKRERTEKFVQGNSLLRSQDESNFQLNVTDNDQCRPVNTFIPPCTDVTPISHSGILATGSGLGPLDFSGFTPRPSDNKPRPIPHIPPSSIAFVPSSTEPSLFDNVPKSHFREPTHTTMRTNGPVYATSQPPNLAHFASQYSKSFAVTSQPSSNPAFIASQPNCSADAALLHPQYGPVPIYTNAANQNSFQSQYVNNFNPLLAGAFPHNNFPSYQSRDGCNQVNGNFIPTSNVCDPLSNFSQFQPSTGYTFNSPYSDLASFLMRKEISLSRLHKFDDNPDTYSVWKAGFCDVMRELAASPVEEMDLLIKYLRPESKRQSLSIRVSNASNSFCGLSLIWERLEDRFASLEIIKALLKKRLETSLN